MYFRKTGLLFLLGMFFLSMPVFASQAPKESSNVDIYCKGEQELKFQNAPYIKDYVVYVPLREFVVRQGGKVSYEAPYVKITGSFGMQPRLIPGQKKYTTSAYEREMEYSSELKDGVTYVPLNEAMHMMFINYNSLEYEIRDGRDKVYIYNRERTEEQKRNFDYSYALSLLKQLPLEQNVSFSPESLKQVLAMMANGTQGNTKQQILDVLHIKNLDTYNSQVRSERNQSQYESANWESANSIWLNHAVSPQNATILKTGYQNLVREYYDGEINAIDGVKDIQKINEWIRKNTNDLVQEVPMDSGFEIMLLNTAHFKGSWRYPFEGAGEKEGIFNNEDGSKGKIDFMSQMKTVSYYEKAGLQAVTLKYGMQNDDYKSEKKAENVPFEMTFIIADTMPNNEMLNHIYQYMDFTEVEITLPKFKIDNEVDFKTVLQGLGVSDLFLQEVADFSVMTAEKGLSVTDIKQKSTIQIDEKGTEASAVSRISAMRGSVSDVAVFKADRPFYFLLRNSDTGTILFEGRYTTAPLK